MNEHQFGLHVSFRLKNILELDGHQIEAPDLTPDTLSALISDVDGDIKQHLRELETFDAEYRPTASRFQHPVILIARLALIDQQYNTLTRQTLVSGQSRITHPSLLTQEAVSYWNSIDTNEYQPQVHVVGGVDEDSSGVWLGISET